MRLDLLLQQVDESAWSKWKLNFILARIIPFNAKHGIKFKTSTADSLTCAIPHRKANLNHLGGIHACALATVGELSAGLLLLKKIDLSKYRLIMADLQVNYHYQAKLACTSTAKLSLESLNSLEQKLQADGVYTLSLVSDVNDISGNHIASVTTTWQLKSWKLVKTKKN